MPLKNGNTVAVERRMDLASLFCMIARHGPAVALAAIAMLSVLAGFIIYRTVRGKRRKATAGDGDSSSPGEDRDASVVQPSFAESTDVSDEGSSDVKEDVDLIQSDLKIRHRRAAAENKPPPYSPLKSDIQVPDSQHTTSDDTEELAVVWDSYKVAETYAEEANLSPQSDTHTEAEMVPEDTVDCHQGERDDAIKDVLEEVHDNDSCWKEPEAINDENHKDGEMVLKEDEDLTTDEEVSDKTTREEEGSFQCALNNPVCFEQTPHISENSDDDRLQDETTNGVESNSEEPVVHMEDVSVPTVCFGKDEEFEKDNPDIIDDSSYSDNNCHSLEEEKKNESEDAKQECIGHQLNAQQAEIWSSTYEQETNLPSTQQEQSDHVTDKVTPPIRDSDWDEDGGLAGEAIEEVINEDHLNKLTAVKFNDSLSGITTTDAKAEISGIADFLELSSDHRQPQKEDEIAPSLDEDTDSTLLGPQMPSHETENPPENNGNGTTVVLAKESNDPQVQSCYEDEKSVQTITNEAFDKANVASALYTVACDGENSTTPMMADKASVTADPETAENVTTSIVVEEISCPQLPSLCQDQQSDRMENNETFDETRVDSAADADACNNVICTPANPDVSSYQDQQSDQTRNNEDFSEVTTGGTPVMIDDTFPSVCQIHLPCFEQFQMRDNDISYAGVGEESGISSMAVSPDAGYEFDMAVEHMTLSVMDYDLQSEGKAEAQNSLFADDAAISVTKDNTAGMVFGPYPSRCSQPPHSDRTGWNNYESFAANEDMLGHEVEDSYHRAMDQFTAQIADVVTSFPDELEKQTDVKVVVEVVEVKEKKAGVSVGKKEETKAEKEKEEDYEKTEISIMEATMDHNEWIMDGTYQTLPWMNLSAPSFTQDHTKNNQLPTEECQYSSAITDITCMDTTDSPPFTETKQTSTVSLVDESMENNKKVVAVQPMPQNVNVTFRVHYFTQSPYQTVAVTGDQQELGNWKGFVALERAKDGHWATVVSLPAESQVEWKFVVVDKGEVCRWEECGNRLLDTGCGDDLLVHKWWGRL